MTPLELRYHVEGEPAWSVYVANVGKWLTANDRGGWRKHADTIAGWRDAAGWSARGTGITPIGRAYMLAEVRFTDVRRRDANNWSPTAKACVDGLIDAGMLADDDAAHVIGPDMRIGPVALRQALVLHIWPVT